MFDAQRVAQGVRLILEGIGEQPDRDGLRETPARVMRMWRDLLTEDTTPLTAFDEHQYDEMIVVRNIRFESICEHHLLPFVGTACIGYIPTSQVLGLSKLVRILDRCSHKLQVQERLTVEVATALEVATQARGVGVVLTAEHTCMTVRGVHRPGTVAVTSALLRAFRSDAATRAEFLALARDGVR